MAAVWLSLALGAALASEPAPGLPEPGDQTLIYYNARMALREGDASEAAKLWLLHNTVEDRTGRISAHDEDFRSVTWAALGQMGLCHDGLLPDEAGAGLWPLALHNTIVRSLNRRKPGRRTRFFDALEVGRQARAVTVHSVLGSRELQSLEWSRGRCLAQRVALVEAGELWWAKLNDRQVAARLLRSLLERARGTLRRDRARGLSVIEARLFDLDLQLAEMAEREARQQARAQGQLGRELGLSRTAAAILRADAPLSTLDPSSPAARVLQRCPRWSVDEWMALSPDRRLVLYNAARVFGADAAALEAVGFGVLDRLIAAGDGADAARWIGVLTPGVEGAANPAAEAIWSGERGARLLALDEARGFRERAVIAAHRGIDQLARGDLDGALRSFAFARTHAPSSAASAELNGLCLRWLGYVAAQFEVSDALLLTLAELVPRQDYATLLEDLMWSAAFHADLRSFETGLANQRGRGALERRLGLLRPLAGGDARRFVAQIKVGLQESPSETLRFLDQLLARLELEDAGVRAAQVPTLRALRLLLEPVAGSAGGRAGRVAGELIGRALSVEQGVAGVPPEPSAAARALAPGGEVYAGSVRLAPADPMPWPFQPVDPPPPSVFTPIELIPVEWRDAQGQWVFGWSIRG